MSRACAVSVLALILATACNATPADLHVDSPAVGANPGQSAALYMELSNTGGTDDSLIGASCECAQSASVHLTEERDGVSMMVATDQLPLPAQETVELHPGGSHIMLVGLSDPLKVGSTVKISLHFADSEDMTVDAPVVAPADLAERVPTS